MTKRIYNFWYILLLGLLSYGCIEEFKKSELSTATVLVVEGRLTDFDSTNNYIRLTLSRVDPYSKMSYSEDVRQAIVELVVDGTEIVRLTGGTSSAYAFPNKFKGRVGHTYQLRFQLIDGTRYESTVESMQVVPPILNISQQFNANSLPFNQLKGYTAANEIFVDYQDPGGVENFYYWTWTLWENQGYCYAGEPYDLPCNRQCWEIFYNTNQTYASDKLNDGQLVLNKQVAKIPFYQESPCLIEIKQYATSRGYYDFTKLVADQTQNTGTLADTPPASLVGNIHNVANKNEPVVGYFGVVSMSSKTYFLDRSNNTGKPIGLFLAQHDRQLKLSPPGVISSSFACINSLYRTSIKPMGWP